MKLYVCLLVSLTVYCSCGNGKETKVSLNSFQHQDTTQVIKDTVKEVSGTPISNQLKDRIIVPQDYKRTVLANKSFGSFLRGLKLKPSGTEVRYFDGSIKANHGIYVGVVDLPIGSKDLHQCADAVMRLRAEYFWQKGEFDQIHFNFTNGHKVEYRDWMKGKRMHIDGNKTQWVQTEEPSNSYSSFWEYLELIFMYAGTASLSKEMNTIPLSEASIGDVLIRGGFPGHAVIIVDEAIHESNGKKVFLLAQSFMPAQEIHIVTNPMDIDLSPWYHLDQDQLITAEWEFSSSDLKRFID